jgi:hypothetical protein
VDRTDDEQAIAQFLKDKGATVCPTVFVAPVAGAVSLQEEARRLAELELLPWLSARALRQATQHAQRGRQRSSWVRSRAVKGVR